MIDNKKYFNILFKSFLWFFTLFIICIIGISNVSAISISENNYATKYYWYIANNNSSTTSTDYRTGSNNRLTLNGATAPTYSNGEGFNGFYNRINYSITKGSIYSLSLLITFNNLLDSEFSRNTINNRLFSTDFVHCSNCTITAVSGSIRRYNSTNQGVSNLYDFVVQLNYTFIATSDATTWYIGSYTGDDRTFGLDNHLYTSIVMIYNLDISNDNSSTIINQNNTIINQNQELIDQNQQNTQDIINNQNSIAEQQEKQQEVCNIIDKGSIKTTNKKLDTNGSFVSSNSYGVTDYVKLGKSLTRVASAGGTSAYFCWYDSSKTLLSCQTLASIDTSTIIPPADAVYFRTSIEVSVNKPQFKVCYNGNQATSNAINDLDNTLNNDNTTDAENQASEFFSSFSTNTFGLTSIITAPLNLINSVLSSNCSNLELPLPYLDNKKLTLPCMSSIYSQYFGSFFTIYQTITYGIIAYWVCVRIFNQVKDFKNPEHDEIEVMDL